MTDHYYSPSPDAKYKIHTVAESLRRHMYIFKTINATFSFKKIDLGTMILIEHITIPSEECVLLDLGCGYGPIGIVLAYESPKSQVYLTDINKRAIWAAKENVKVNIQNYKSRVFALSGSYFEPIRSKNLRFDAIYTNPPIRQGRKAFLSIVEEVRNYLKPNGFFQFVIRKKMGASFILEYFKKSFPSENIDVVCKRSGYWVFKCFHD
jgi:16S rRNA (guanine1207-N2)-methyltransferase